jgi:streptogramin lyase
VGLICLTGSALCSATDVTSHASHEYSGGSACSSSVPVCNGSLYAGSTPRFVAAGPDGNVWFTDNGTTPAIAEINPTSGAISEWSIALNGGTASRSPGTIEAGPDGNLWFADAVPASPAIGQFNLTAHTVTEYGQSNGLQAGSLVNGTMEGPDGNMWFTDSATTPGDAPIEMICLTGSRLCSDTDTATHAIHEFPVVTYPTSIGNSGGIGSDGNLWWTDLSPTATPTGPAIGQFSLGACRDDSLPDCKLKGANLQNISLDGANLQGSNLKNAQLENASLVGADLRDANLSGAQLQNYAQLQYANLEGANLRGADLTGANLTGANLTDANLHHATLTGAVWSNTTCPDGTNSDGNGGTCENERR